MKGIAKIAAIDCDDDKNKQTCGQYGVQGFPTLKIFRPSSKKGKPTVEGMFYFIQSPQTLLIMIDYNGARTAKAITDTLAEHIPNHVVKVTDDKLDGFLNNKNETAKAILFTNKGTTAALWKSLAVDFLDNIIFAQIRDTHKEALKTFGVEKAPTIILLPGGDVAAKVYDGKMEKAPLAKFFGVIKPTDSKKEPKKKQPESDKESSPEPVEQSSTSEQPKPTEKRKLIHPYPTT